MATTPHSPRNPRPVRASSVAVIAGVFLCLSLAGCESAPEGPPPAQIIANAEQVIADAKARLTTLPEADPGRVKAEETIGKLEKSLTDYKARVAVQEKAGVHPDDAAAIALTQTVGGMFGPVGSAISGVASVLLIPTIGGWIRSSRKRKEIEAASNEVLKAIQTVAASNGGMIDFNDEMVRTQLKAEMNDAGMNRVTAAGATVPRVRKTVTRKAKPKPRNNESTP